MTSLGSQWKRFLLLACGSQSHNSLHKSPGDWQRLSEMAGLLLRACPPSRLAVLDQLTQLFVHYFYAWWAHHGQASPPSLSSSSSSVLGVSPEGKTDVTLEEVENAGAALRELVVTLRQVVMSVYTPDEFMAAVCGWILARLRPVCVLPPTDLLDSMFESIRSLDTTRVNINSGFHQRQGDTKAGSPETASSQHVDTTGRRWQSHGKHRVVRPRHRKHKALLLQRTGFVKQTPEGSRTESPALLHLGEPAASSPRSTSPSSSSSTCSTSSSVDLDSSALTSGSEPESDPVRPDPHHLPQSTLGRARDDESADNGDFLPLDTSLSSPVSRNLLGPWSTCPLLMDLLTLAYEMVMGTLSRTSTLQMLIASATEWPSDCHPNGAVLPHWVMVWLVYQLAWQSSTLVKVTSRRTAHVVTCILEAAVRGPIDQSAVTWLSSTMQQDTVAWWCAPARHVDPNCWTACCLTHLLFLGEDVTPAVAEWVSRSLDEIVPDSGTGETVGNVMSDNAVLGFVRVLLNLGLATVPLPMRGMRGGGLFGTGPFNGSAQLPISSSAVDPSYRLVAPPDPGFIGVAANFPGQPFPRLPFPAPPLQQQQQQQYSLLPVGGICRLPVSHVSLATGTTGTSAVADRGGGGHFITPPPPFPLWPGAPPLLPPSDREANNGSSGGGFHRPPTAALQHHTRVSGLHQQYRHRHRRSHPNQGHYPAPPPAHQLLQHSVCSPRLSASSRWLAMTARAVRVCTVRTLVDRLLLLLLAPSQRQDGGRLAALVRQLTGAFHTVDPVGSGYLRMLVEVIVRSPGECGLHRLLARILDWSAAGQAEDSHLAPIRNACRQILSICASTVLSMVYTCTDLPDEAELYGCQGFLTAAERLATLDCPSAEDTCYWRSPVRLEQQLLIWYATTRMDPWSTLPAAQLLVCLAMTSRPQLAEQMLFHLCCAAAAPAPNMSPLEETRIPTPLLLFFPCLDELEAAWTARHPTTTSKASPRCCCCSAGTGHRGYGHELLAHRFLPLICQSVGHHQRQSSALVVGLLASLLWLLRREQKLFTGDRGQQQAEARRPPRLLMALFCRLGELLRLTELVTDTQTLDFLMAVYEKVLVDLHLMPAAEQQIPADQALSASKRSPRPSRGSSQQQTMTRTLTTTASPCLSASDCFSTGRRLVTLFLHLLNRLEGQLAQVKADSDAKDVAHLSTLRVLHRVERLLVGLSNSSGQHQQRRRRLLASSAIQCLVEAVASRPRPDSYKQMATITSALVSVPPGLKDSHWNSVDADLADITCRHRYQSANSSKGGAGFLELNSLLLNNPPNKLVLPHGLPDDDSLVRGRLREPVCAWGESDEKACRSFESGEQLTVTCFYTVRLLRQLICGPVASVRQQQRQSASKLFASDDYHLEHHGRRHLLMTAGACLEAVLLPQGAHLPQTSITRLPVPFNLVQQPIGIGLERVLRLAQRFCPRLFLDSLWHSFSEVTRSESLLKAILHLVLTPDWLVGGTSDASCLASAPEPPGNEGSPSAEFELPCHKLILGLLMGLEAAWLSPLAPRESIPQSLAFLKQLSGRYAQGVFPVAGKPISARLCDLQARRTAVDYAQRRVDRHSALFRFTKQLVLALFRVWPTDLQTATTTGQTAFPLDNLLDYLTPRELFALVSDIRRNLRPRLGFSLLRSGKVKSAFPIPPDPWFVSPGLLLALLHAHLVEPGVAQLVGPLVGNWQSVKARANASANSVDASEGQSVETMELSDDQSQELVVLEEIDVDGELMVVVDG